MAADFEGFHDRCVLQIAATCNSSLAFCRATNLPKEHQLEAFSRGIASQIASITNQATCTPFQKRVVVLSYTRGCPS